MGGRQKGRLTNLIPGCGVLWGGWSYPEEEEEAILVGRGAAPGFRKNLRGRRAKGA